MEVTSRAKISKSWVLIFTRRPFLVTEAFLVVFLRRFRKTGNSSLNQGLPISFLNHYPPVSLPFDATQSHLLTSLSTAKTTYQSHCLTNVHCVQSVTQLCDCLRNARHTQLTRTYSTFPRFCGGRGKFRTN